MNASLLSRLRRARWVHGVQLIVFTFWVMNPFPGAFSYWTDSNADNIKEEVANPPEGDPWWEQDSDADGIVNGTEVYFGSDPYSLDSDHDGLADPIEYQYSAEALANQQPLPYDPWNWDTNGNGFSDFDEFYQQIQGYTPVANYSNLRGWGTPFFSYFDADGDGLRNFEDGDPLNNDRDGDGILNWNDTGYMDDANNGYTPPPENTDPGVWIGGSWYPAGTLDSDGDGTPDHLDAFAFGSFWYNGIEYGGSWSDRDGDNVPDPADAFPDGSFWYAGVEYAGVWMDQDNDQVPDCFDAWPTIAGSYWYLTMEYPGTMSDRDADGVPDALDATPDGSFWWAGVEYSGQFVDQDNDGIPDPFDSFPTQAGSYWYQSVEYPGSWSDQDGDGIPDAADPIVSGQGSSYWWQGVEYSGLFVDQDNDGIPDGFDPFPTTVGSYWYDGTEYAGVWSDADNDNIPDAQDAWPNDWWNGTPHYTYNGSEYPGDINDDRDGDAVPDTADNWPDDPDNNADNDGDGISNYDERTQFFTHPDLQDTDGEGLTDYEELFTWHTNPLAQKTDANQLYTDFYTVDQTDTDADGIPDRIELWYAQLGYTMGSDGGDDARADFDADGYTNLQAYRNGWSFIAHLNAYDNDADGILDVLEDAWSAAYPGILSSSSFEDAVQDFDNDGLMNFEEIALGLNPGSAYSRSTAVPDLLESVWRGLVGGVAFSIGPIQFSGSTPPPSWAVFDDTDHDGVADGLMALVNDCNAGTSGLTLPVRVAGDDYDGDGMPDVWEHRYHLQLRDAADANANNDGDSLTNAQEYSSSPPRDPLVNDDLPLQIVTESLPPGTLNQGYSATIELSGVVSFTTFSLISGRLPDGVALDSNTGVISGTINEQEGQSFTVQVSDQNGRSAQRDYYLSGDGPPDTGGGGGGDNGSGDTPPPPPELAITTTALPGGFVLSDYSASLSAAHGSAPYTFSVLAAQSGESGLPFSYNLQNDGTLLGYADSVGLIGGGTYTFTVQVTDNAGHTAQKQLVLVLAGVTTGSDGENGSGGSTGGGGTTGGGDFGGGGTSGSGGNNNGGDNSGSGGTGGNNTSGSSGGGSSASPIEDSVKLVSRSTSAGLGSEVSMSLIKKPFNGEGEHRTQSEAQEAYGEAKQGFTDSTTDEAPHEMPVNWIYYVETTDPDTGTSTGMAQRSFFGTEAEAQAAKDNESPEGGSAPTTDEKPWRWKLVGMKLQPDENGGEEDSPRIYLRRDWDEENATTFKTAAEIATMTTDAPLAWLDPVLQPPSNPLSEAEWLQRTEGSNSATGRWQEANSHKFPTGGATEVRLKRSDTSEEAMEQAITRTFLRVTTKTDDDPETEDPTPTVEAVTLTIEPGQKVSTSGTGPGAANGSVVLVGRPDAENKNLVVGDKLVPVSIGVYPIPDPDEAATYRVSADQHEVTLSATVHVAGLPAGDGSSVMWEFEDAASGGSFSSAQTTTTNGFTSTKLRTSTTPGDTFKARCTPVSLKLPDDEEAMQEVLNQGGTGSGGDGGRAATIEVVPGLAASSGMTHGGGSLTMPADGKSEREVSITVKDKFGHKVHAGTPVSWHLKGLGKVKSKAIETDADGVARATIVAGTVAGVQKVQVIADAGLHEVTIQNTPLNPTVAAASGTLDASQTQSTTVTASFPGAAEGAQVVWHATRGSIVNAQSAVSGGQAQATFLSEPGPDGTAFVAATVGSSTGWARIPLVSQGPLRITQVSQPVLAANATTDGTLPVRTSTGGTLSAGYAASAQVSIHMPGKGGQTARLGFGSLGVHEGARFAFDALHASGVFRDAANLHSATPAGVTLDTEQKFTGEGAVKLSADSSLALDASSAFELRPGFHWQGWVRPEQLGGDLIDQPGQYRLLMDAGGVLRFSVLTSTGEKTVTLPQQPLVTGQWQQVTARYLGEQGGITLSVGGITAQAAAAGEPAAATQTAVLGGGYAGWLDEVRIGIESTGGGVGALLTTDQPGDEITLDAEGRGTFTVSSTGQMAEGGTKAVALQVQVGNEAVQSVPNVLIIADQNDMVRTEVLLETAQPDAGFTAGERGQIVAGQLGKMARSGQRCDAANLPASGTLGQQAEAGYQMGLFIGKGGGELGEGSFAIRLFGENLPAVGAEADYLRERLAQFAEEAARQGSDAAAQNYASQNGGKLVEELAKYLRDKLGDQRPMVDTIEFGPIPQEVADKLFAIPEVLDGQEAVEDFSTIAQKDPGLFDDLLESAKKGVRWVNEAVRYTGTLIADGFNYVTAPLNDLVKWKNKLINGLEDLIKKSIEEGLAEGSISQDKAFKIGTAWGAVRQLTDAMDIVSPEVAGQMISSLTGMVIGAIKGDEKSQKALAGLAPVIGTMETAEEMNNLLSDGKHFEAGVKFTEFAISASEDAAFVTGLGGVVGGVVKFLRKTLKHARPPRGALTPRHPPDWLPDEMGSGFTLTGGHANSGKGKSHADSPRSHEFTEFEKHIRSEYGKKATILTGPEAITAIEEYRKKMGIPDDQIINGVFDPIKDNHARILMGPNATLYDFWHESLHMDHFLDFPENGRKIAFETFGVPKAELEVVKRMRAKPEAWKALSPMQQAHALIYAEKFFTTTPSELIEWIREWEQKNKGLKITEQHNLYLGLPPN